LCFFKVTFFNAPTATSVNNNNNNSNNVIVSALSLFAGLTSAPECRRMPPIRCRQSGILGYDKIGRDDVGISGGRAAPGAAALNGGGGGNGIVGCGGGGGGNARPPPVPPIIIVVAGGSGRSNEPLVFIMSICIVDSTGCGRNDGAWSRPMRNSPYCDCEPSLVA
jgi:hypothetical protein